MNAPKGQGEIPDVQWTLFSHSSMTWNCHADVGESLNNVIWFESGLHGKKTTTKLMHSHKSVKK